MNTWETERLAQRRARLKEEEDALLGEKQEIPVEKLIRLAREYSRGGWGEDSIQLLSKTLQRVRKIQDLPIKSGALLHLAFIFKEVGQLYTAPALVAEAQKAADGAPSPSSRCRAWLNLAREYLQAESSDECQKLLNRAEKEAAQIKEEAERSEILSLLADIYLESGDQKTAGDVISRARQAAAEIHSASTRAWTLIKIHDTYARMEEAETALQILSEAFRITKIIQPPLNRDRKLSAISGKYARLGRYEEAIGVAWAITNQTYRGIALYVLASKQRT